MREENHNLGSLEENIFDNLQQQVQPVEVQNLNNPQP
jgi:hypothetical protein